MADALRLSTSSNHRGWEPFQFPTKFRSPSEALVGIDSLAVLPGHLPPRAQGLVVEWSSIRQAELREAWDRAKRIEPPGKIAPLECWL